MKKIIALVLGCIIALSCTACGFSQGNPANQEKQLMEFVNKYYGEADIVDKQSEILDTASIYRLKDKTDGFIYTMTALEVYMSDLGFVPNDAQYADYKTIAFDGQFIVKYVGNLVKAKLQKEAFEKVLQDYPALLDVSVLTYETTFSNIFTLDTEETAFMMAEMDESAIRAMASLMKEQDTRDMLKYYIMPIYQAEEVNGVTEMKYDISGQPMVLGYYDFFFDYILKPEVFDGIGTLHDYFMEQDYKNIVIKSAEPNINPNAVQTEEGFEFLPYVEVNGTFIVLEIDGEMYEFFTLPGVKKFDSATDEYGIHQGSFLDIMATKRSGGRDIMIAYYATMYPQEYTSMTLHFQPLQIVEPDQTTPDTEHNHDHTTEEGNAQ